MALLGSCGSGGGVDVGSRGRGASDSGGRVPVGSRGKGSRVVSGCVDLGSRDGGGGVGEVVVVLMLLTGIVAS